MTAKKQRKWSYMPIDIFADPDLSPRDLQVMGVLCSSTNTYGICFRSQVKIADCCGLAVPQFTALLSG